MSAEVWLAAFERAWRQFYRIDNMIAALKRCRSKTARWNLLLNFLWYRWSFATERTHPMIAGFYRVRPYAERRPGAPSLPYWRYLLQEGWRHLRYVGRFLAEFYRFQHIYFEVELGPHLAGHREYMADKLHGIRDWLHRTFGHTMRRQWLNSFWIEYARNRWHLLNPLKAYWHLLACPHALTEIVYSVRFALRLKKLFKVSAS